MCGLPALLSQAEAMRRDMIVNQALRHPSIRFSTTLAQNQPLAEIVGHGLQFDLSAMKKECRGRNLLMYILGLCAARLSRFRDYTSSE